MSKKSKTIKLSMTAYRVILILLLLNEEKYTLDGLTERLSNDKLVSRSFSKEVIIKYINTLRFSGFDIEKYPFPEGVYYQLRQSPFLTNFSEEELKTLAYTKKHINYLYQPHLIANFNQAFEKISRFLTAENCRLLESYQKEASKLVKDKYNKFSCLIKQIEEFCLDRQTVQITYSPFEDLIQKITLEPEKILYSNHKVYICGNNPKIQQKQHLQLDYILDIKQLPTKSRASDYDFNITFKLTGKLAKAYRIYDREEIVDQTIFPPSLIVSANVSDMDSLLHRLLRYGQFCEVLSPKNAREKMQQIINELLIAYEEKLA